EPPVRFGRGPKPRVLPHGPEACPVHRRLDAARVGVLAGEPELTEIVEARELRWRPETRHRCAPGRLKSGSLGRPVHRRPGRLLLPAREALLQPERPARLGGPGP